MGYEALKERVCAANKEINRVELAILTWGNASEVDREAVDLRRVLVPPIALLLVVALFSATGAFHWEGPQPRRSSADAGS